MSGFSLMATLGLNASKFNSELEGSASKAKEAGHGIGSSLGEELSGRLMQFASFGAIEEAVRNTVEYADKIDDLSKRTGIGAGELQRWDYALGQTGSTIEEGVSFLEKLSIARKKAMGGDDGKQAAFRDFKIEMADLQSLRIEELGRRMAEAWQEGDPQHLIASLRELGGKGAGAMGAAFADDFAAKLRDASVMADEATEKLGRLPDMLKTIWAGTRSAMGDIGGGVYDAIERQFHLIGGTFSGLMKAMVPGKGASGNPLSLFGSGFLDYYKNLKAEEDTKKAEQDKQKAAKQAAFGEEEDQKKSEATAKRVLKINEDAAKIRERTSLSEMTNAEKLIALEEKKAKIPFRGAFAKDAEEKAELHKEEAELDADISKTKREIKAEKDRLQKKNDGMKPDVNALQKIGAYSSAPELELLDVNRKSEQHLEQIKESLKVLQDRSATTSGVTF